MIRFLYFLLVAIVVRYVWRLLAEWAGSELQRRLAEAQRARAEEVPGSEPGSGRRTLYKGVMVRDPVCGIHLPEGRALRETHSGTAVYFCSEGCRKRFLSGEVSGAGDDGRGEAGSTPKSRARA